MKVSSFKYNAISLAVLSAATVSVQASTAIDTLVITAAGYEQDVAQAAASISVISRDKIENRSYRDITAALKDVPGVVLTGGGANPNISIRGMPVKYTAFLVDGRKQSGRETQPNGSKGFEQEWLPPLAAIERIEVIRGPMSTLYGSDALGGVINIITRKDAQTWTGNLRTEATMQNNSLSGDYFQAQLHLAGPVVDDVLNLSLTALVQDRKEDEINRGYGAKELTNYQGSLFYKATEQDMLTFNLAKQDQKRSTTEDFSSSSSTEQNNNRKSVSLVHAGDYQGLKTKSFIQSESIENVGREMEIKNLTLNTQFSKSVADHYVTLGANLQKERLNDPSNSGVGSTLNSKQWSLFLEDEWLLSDEFSLTLAARVDDNKQFSRHVSPRVYGVWSIDDTWTLKTGVSTGYSAPGLRETSANWVKSSRGGDIYGNPNLTPESSVNKELGLYYSGLSGVDSNITLFHNDYKDKLVVTSCPIALCGGASDRYNVNIDKAITRGIEVSVTKDFSDRLSMDASFTYTHSEQKSGDNAGQPLTQVPHRLLSVNFNWQASDKLNTWASMNYRSGESKGITLSTSSDSAPSVNNFDVGGSWKINQQAKFSVGVYNLFDKQVGYDEYGYVEDGRRLWLAFDASF